MAPGLRFGRRHLLAGAAAAGADLWLGAPLARASSGDAVAAILEHHDRSKHRPGRPARAPARVEWRAQPDPFRRFHGAPVLPLDLVPPSPEPTWDALASGRVPPRPLDGRAISQLLFDSLALSAWKERGDDRWPLRVNPSSGNLHPVEAYLAGGPFPGLTDAPALLHYAPHEHALELRARLPDGAWRPLEAALPAGGFLVALTAIVWREAWKYGERAWRYTLLDAGHALAAVSLAAAGLGWRTRIVTGWGDRDVARLTGADRQSGPEAERAEVLLAAWPGPAPWEPERERDLRATPEVRAALADLPLVGSPRPLGGEPREWLAIEEAVRAAERPGSTPAPRSPGAAAGPALPDRGLPGRALVRGRRSALGFDPAASIGRSVLLRILERTSPAAARAALSPFPWPTSTHLALLVHRVDGLTPGLYLLPRSPDALPDLRAALGSARHAWEEVAAPASLPLLRLSTGDLTSEARAACCDQDTGSEGAFVAAMVAGFEPALRTEGPWAYRRLHWEAGALGQALYLEAEAAGLRATAMGCFLDDELHRLLGVADRRFQVLYTLAVGRAVEDPRLRTTEPYAHRR